MSASGSTTCGGARLPSFARSFRCCSPAGSPSRIPANLRSAGASMPNADPSASGIPRA
ncbi:MAG: hypothetical protein R3B70_40065 [Polyangiaceae bacterium]